MLTKFWNRPLTQFSYIAAALLTTFSTVQAQEIAIGIEAIKGENHYELETMQSADVAVSDEPGVKKQLTETHNFNTKWNEREEVPALVSLFYLQDIGPVRLELGGKAVQFRPEYDFLTIHSKDFKGKEMFVLPMHAKIVEDNFDLEAAVSIPLMDDKLKLRPKIGERKENFTAKFQGIGPGNSQPSGHAFVVAKEIEMLGIMHGPYAGMDIYYELFDHFEVFVGASSIHMTGFKDELEWEAEAIDNGQKPFVVERVRTKAVLTGNIYQGGVVIGLAKHMHMHIGYIHEDFKVRYPGYSNLLRFQSSSSGNKVEFPAKHDATTDYFIYGKHEKREKRHIVVGLVYELDFRSGNRGENWDER